MITVCNTGKGSGVLKYITILLLLALVGCGEKPKQPALKPKPIAQAIPCPDTIPTPYKLCYNKYLNNWIIAFDSVHDVRKYRDGSGSWITTRYVLAHGGGMWFAPIGEDGILDRATFDDSCTAKHYIRMYQSIESNQKHKYDYQCQ